MATTNKKNTVKNQVTALKERPDATVNHEGSLAFTHGPHAELYKLAATSFMEDKFYESASQQLARLKDLVKKSDRDFVLSLANYTRNKLNLRSVSVMLLVLAAMKHDKKNAKQEKKSVRQYVSKVVQRADELSEVVSAYISINGSKKGFPNALRRGLADAFHKFDDYQLQKYNNLSKAVKLRDVLRLTHVKPKDEKESLRFKQLKDNELPTPETWETHISANGSTAETWNQIAPKMGFMALLRNLRNFEDKGAKEALALAISKIEDPKEVAKSKQLPFRFLSAERNVSTQKAKDACRMALQNSVVNLPKLGGVTAIFGDTSPSMNKALSAKSVITYSDVSCLMSAMARYMADDAYVGVFGDTLQMANLSKLDSVLSNAEKIRRIGVGWATNAYLTIKHLLDNKLEVDRVMVFTDEQVYGTGHFGSFGSPAEFQKLWIEYKRKYPKAKLYVFNLAGQTGSIFPENQHDVHLIAGWSDQVLSYVAEIERGETVVLQEIADNW